MSIKVPSWKNTKVLYESSLANANEMQKQFYYIFKSEFLQGKYIDLEGNFNYAFVLMNDFVNDFKKNKDYDSFSSLINVLVSNYPALSTYRNDTLLGTLLELSRNDDITIIPIVKSFIDQIYKETEETTFVLKSINELILLLNCKPTNEKNIHFFNIVFTRFLYNLGIGITPDLEIDCKEFHYGDLCILYRLNDKFDRSEKIKLDRITQEKKYSFLIIFIKLATKIILEDKLSFKDNQYLDMVISEFIEKKYFDDFFKLVLKRTAKRNDSLNKRITNKSISIFEDYTKLHLKAFARWTFSGKKPIFDTTMKKFIAKQLNSAERMDLSNKLINLVCLDGNINEKRINSLKKILPTLDYSVEEIHLHIHRVLTGEYTFPSIVQNSETSEYAVNNQNTNMCSINYADASSIDKGKLNIISRQTQEVQDILSNIFIDKDNQNLVATPVSETTSWESVLKALLTKDLWAKEDAEQICINSGVILGAVLEQINDYTIEKVGDVLVEDEGGTIRVNLEYKEDLV